MHPGPYCKIYSKEGSNHNPQDMYRTIPSITNEDIQKFWKKDFVDGKESDTWQQLMYFISHNSLMKQIHNIEKNLQQMGSATKSVLGRASRVRLIDDL